MEEFERLNNPIEEKQDKNERDGKLSPFMKFGKASFIIWKALWYSITKILKGIYNGLLALNDAIDKARKSEAGKAMMKKHEKDKKQGYGFGMSLWQKQGKKQKHNKERPLGWEF